MNSGIFHVLAIVSGIATGASLGYCLLTLLAAAGFVRRAPAAKCRELPGISILKPLKGSDPELYEALRSHCVQGFPDYEILFGITEPGDPAGQVVEKLMAEFPGGKLRLVVCEKRLGANGKVSTLAQLLPLAQREILLVNDSDIRVPPDYLRTIAAELQQPSTGLVTCLYRGSPAGTMGSQLEALGISTDFAPGVLVAWLIERGLHFGLGSTLAFRRSDLQAIGGFEAILDYLADDYELGKRISQRHLKVELSRAVVETHLPAYNLSGFFSHQLRWARTIRASRAGGYAGLLLTFTIPWATAALIFSRASDWAGWLFAAALLIRLCAAIATCQLVLRDRKALRSLWLLPIRDFVGILVWIGGWIGDGIVWRGEKFVLEGGKLRPV